MKKSILIAGSVLCLFILCSLSYQPMVADVKLDKTNITNNKWYPKLICGWLNMKIIRLWRIALLILYLNPFYELSKWRENLLEIVLEIQSFYLQLHEKLDCPFALPKLYENQFNVNDIDFNDCGC